LYTLSALFFRARKESEPRLAAGILSTAPLANRSLAHLRADKCATRHISGLPQPELGFLCQFRSTRIELEAKANAFKDVAVTEQH
jgi:hypothetical protein